MVFSLQQRAPGRRLWGKLEHGDRVVLIHNTQRDLQHDTHVALGKFRFAPILEESRGLDGLGQPRQEQRGIRPIKNVNVNPIALLRGYAPRVRGNGAAARAVNRLAVLGQPLADLPQARNELWLNLAVRHRADVQKEIGIVARGAHQVVDQLTRTLVVAIVKVEAPRLVDRLARFERQSADF